MSHEHASDDRSAVGTLLQSIKRDHTRLVQLLEASNSHWEGEDLVYRFWHQSSKVFLIQDITQRLVDALRALAPTSGPLNQWFEKVIAEGTGLTFDLEDNKRWLEVTSPMLEAFFHARYMVEMAVKYGRELDDPPSTLPSGWAALLTLYKLR